MNIFLFAGNPGRDLDGNILGCMTARPLNQERLHSYVPRSCKFLPDLARLMDSGHLVYYVTTPPETMWDDSTKKMMCRGLKMIHEDYPDAIIVGEVPPVLREEMLKYPSLMYRDHRGIV